MTERTKRVTAFLNEQEYALLEKQCADAGMKQSVYLRSLIVRDKPIVSKQGYPELLQHIADLDGAVFSMAETAKENPAIRQEDIDRLLCVMDDIWKTVKGSL